MAQLLSSALIYTALNAATGTGTGASNVFYLGDAPSGGDKVVEYNAFGTFSVATANLEESWDGGTTWGTKVAAIDLKAAPLGYFNAIPGKLMRFNVQSFTGTSVSVAVVSS